MRVDKSQLLGYTRRKKQNGKVLESKIFEKAFKQIRGNLQNAGCVNVNQDVLHVLTLWVDYIRELKIENSRIETIIKNYSRIDNIFQNMNKRIEMLEMQWKEDESTGESI
ncbi:uncharacterized protein LOC134255916 [Saccostrea cucullata]|uniref:uncharacterized protein LOC134255916 n=1 Tax=Saccostrea cuccullata TaxID=36930 RepID=UPI002ED22AA9